MAEKAGVAQRTVGSFIEPKVRLDTTTRKEPSGTIANLAKIADALKIPAWQLMRPFSADEWKAYEAVEEAFLVLHKNIAKPKAEVKRPSIDAANAHTVKDKANQRK